MFYIVSKILFFVLQPSSVIALMLFAGVALLAWTSRRRLGLGLALGGLALLVVAGLTPLGNALVIPLEQRFPPLGRDAVADDVAGLIILGGAEDSWVTGPAAGLGLNEAAERFTEAARLALAHPRLKVVFTGGVGRLWGGGVSAAEPVREFLAELGVARERIVLEGVSRNTRENATLTAAVLGAKPGERWLLVTSAYHMPRAVGVFRRVGLDVVAFPVDFRTRGNADLTRFFPSITAGLERVDLAAKEWIGLVGYRLAGYTDTLFPAVRMDQARR